MAEHALRREGRQSSIAPHRTLWRARSRPAIPPHVTPHASSPPNHPTRSVRMQKPPRASRDMIAARAPIHGLPFAYGIPHVLPTRPSSQISPHTKRAAHILPSECAAHCHGRTRSARGVRQSSIVPHRTLWRARSRPAHNPPHEHACSAVRAAFLCAHDISLTQAAPAQQKRSVSISPKRKSRRAVRIGDCAAVRHIDYAFASVSMAWANIVTLSMNFSQSTYSSGIWQVSVSPGKLMPNATVLGIMRE